MDDIYLSHEGYGEIEKALHHLKTVKRREISKDIGCRCVFVDSLIDPETIKFYLNMGFDFVDKPLGKIIVNKLASKEKIDRNTIKMYFDLFTLKNPNMP